MNIKDTNIKMIVTDLDRTLLRSDKSISDNTIKMLEECRKRGIKIVFATARPIRRVTSYFEKIKCDGVIFHNGAVVHILGEEISKTGIDHEVCKNILLRIVADNPSVNLSVEIDEVLYANFDVSKVWSYVSAIRTDFTDLPRKNADKIIVCMKDPEDILKLEQYLPDNITHEKSH